MKTSLLISLICGMTLLAGCSTTSKPGKHLLTSQQGMPAKTIAIQKLPTSHLKLYQAGGHLTAQIHTDWNEAQQGDLKLHWIAPKRSYCISTSFPIMKYRETSDSSWAYRTLRHDKFFCAGNWTAEVLYKPTNVVIGKTHLNVKPISAQ